MKKDYSAPVVIARPAHAHSTQKGGQVEMEEKKRVDYSHLDIIAEAERIIDRRLVRHTRTSGKYKCQCPFEGCSSLQDAFLVFDRPVLEEGEKHFWCNRCGKRGSLLDLVEIMAEQRTGEKPTWAEKCAELRIDPRTWRAADDSDQSGRAEPRQATASDQRRQERERQYKAEQEEVALLGAWYVRARAWLAAGRITMKDGRQIELDQARAYLAERGFSLEQAALLGIAYIPTAKECPELSEDKTLAPWRGRILFPLAGPKSASGYAGRSLWKWAQGMPAEQHKRLLDAWNEKHKGDWSKQVQRYYKTRQPAYYGYEDACQASTLVIVEGEFDAGSCRLALEGLPDVAVCAFGKNFQARLVPINVFRVILALDLDQAGQEAIASHCDELEARGVTVEIARPAVGKDWNDCLLLAGPGAIREAIFAQQAEKKSEKERKGEVVGADQSEQETREFVTLCNAIPGQQRIEPPGYENGDICLLCGQQVEETEGAYVIVEDKASEFYGDTFCAACWAKRKTLASVEQSESSAAASPENRDQEAEQSRAKQRTDVALAHTGEVFDSEHWPEPYTLTLLPDGMSSAEYIERYTRGERPGRVIHPAEMAEAGDQSSELARNAGQSRREHLCRKHGKPLMYGDELGGRYCDHVDCWERYRLIRTGARRGYAALYGIVDRSTTADTSKPPLRYFTMPGTGEQAPVYPDRPPVKAMLIEAGADAWSDYVSRRGYQDIDQAVKALASA